MRWHLLLVSLVFPWWLVTLGIISVHPLKKEMAHGDGVPQQLGLCSVRVAAGHCTPASPLITAQIQCLTDRELVRVGGKSKNKTKTHSVAQLEANLIGYFLLYLVDAAREGPWMTAPHALSTSALALPSENIDSRRNFLQICSNPLATIFKLTQSKESLHTLFISFLS